MSNKNRRVNSSGSTPLWGRSQKLIDRVKDALILLSAVVLLVTQVTQCTEGVVELIGGSASEKVEVVPASPPAADQPQDEGCSPSDCQREKPGLTHQVAGNPSAAHR